MARVRTYLSNIIAVEGIVRNIIRVRAQEWFPLVRRFDIVGEHRKAPSDHLRLGLGSR